MEMHDKIDMTWWMMDLSLLDNHFLVADTRLFISWCRSVGRYVRHNPEL